MRGVKRVVPETPEERKARQHAWYLANREKVLAQGKAWKVTNPEHARATGAAWREANRGRHNASNARSRAAFKAFVDQYKVTQGCVDCGYNAHPAALHFDHRDRASKTVNIGQMTTATRARLLAEIAKCDVRCANCHAIKTHSNGEYFAVNDPRRGHGVQASG